MNERTYRLIQGGIILSGLVLEFDWLIYLFLCTSVFEGLTGLRIPVLVSRLRKQPTVHAMDPDVTPARRIPIEAERMMRLTVSALLAVSYLIYPEETWFFPWFMGTMLVMAGISNICPMVIYYRWLGFR
jgi:hypothetical protein